MFVKMVLSSVRAFICWCDGSVYSGLDFDFWSASVSSRAACVALSRGSVRGAGQLWGKNLTDFAILSDLDFGMYTSWYL